MIACLFHIWFFTASPPKTLTLDEVMESTRDLSNLSWAHEISINPNFHVEQANLPQGRYMKKIWGLYVFTPFSCFVDN